MAATLPNIWLPALVERFASFLHPNEVICTLRYVNKATAAQFRGRPEFASVRLSQPVPPHAFAARWAAPGAMRDLTLEQRKKLLCLTATSGVMSNLEVALEAVGVAVDTELQSDLSRSACKAGHSSMACHLLIPVLIAEPNQSCIPSLEEAATAGHWAVWEALQRDSPIYGAHLWSPDYVVAALSGGHLEAAEYLLERTLAIWPMSDRIWGRFLEAAAGGCGLPTLESLHQRCGSVPLTMVVENERTIGSDLLSSAAGSRTADWQAKVEWAESQLPPGFTRDSEACAAAAARPDAELRLAWLLARGYPADGKAADAAIHAHNVAALELLLARGLRPTYFAIAAAACYGRLGMLKEVRRHGGRLNADVVAWGAVDGGQVPVLEWAVEELGAQLQDVSKLLFSDVSRCSLGTLKRLHQQGWPCEARKAALGAAKLGDMATLRWAVEELGASPQDASLMDAAAREGRVEVMVWLRERGCPWGKDMFDCALHSGCGAALEWLVEQGCPMPVS
ncbi:hypothetical protein GPECTOR_81g189 [Gonium pectorale]|uniref:Uncharacterized protein n=1 Tax=Gonium pectorale TaxID=33097 RepID=A0A150G1Q2_GONPE|nr:hypothetical protein GPECTOR_81g189 [Gonium pectorale]|eukprot:KXZ43741.1 hypothetical protein GPECTOR_81g189 [Gonium pectorale]